MAKVVNTYNTYSAGAGDTTIYQAVLDGPAADGAYRIKQIDSEDGGASETVHFLTWDGTT